MSIIYQALEFQRCESHHSFPQVAYGLEIQHLIHIQSIPKSRQFYFVIYLSKSPIKIPTTLILQSA